jgi:hypothetical protein
MKQVIPLGLAIWSLIPTLVPAFQPNVATSSWNLSARRQHPKLRRIHLKSRVGGAVSQQGSKRVATADWSFIDGVYLITCPNADPGGERVEKTKGILRDAGLLEKLQIKDFDTDDENRIRGCYTSHISVLRDIVGSEPRTNQLDDLLGSLFGKVSNGIEEKDVNMLIFEDNLALNGFLRQGSIEAVAKYSQSGTPWDMIHLAYIPYVPDLVVTKTSSDKIVKLSCGVGSALGTTAYIINTKAIKRILQEDDERGFYAPIPDVMAKLFPESRYAIDPTIFVRAPNTKSLVNPQLDDLRSLLFQPPVAAFVQRLLVFTGLSTTALLPLVIVFLLALAAASAKLSFDSAWSLASTGSFDGPIIFPVVSTTFTIFSLAVIAQGAILAPKPAKPTESDSQ